MNSPVNKQASNHDAGGSTVLSVVFRPACNKTHGDISRQLRLIETVIVAAGGADFSIHPHDCAAYCFTLGARATPLDAESVVAALNGLRDTDGAPLVDAEQGEARTVPKSADFSPPQGKKQLPSAQIL